MIKTKNSSSEKPTHTMLQHLRRIILWSENTCAPILHQISVWPQEHKASSGLASCEIGSLIFSCLTLGPLLYAHLQKGRSEIFKSALEETEKCNKKPDSTGSLVHLPLIQWSLPSTINLLVCCRWGMLELVRSLSLKELRKKVTGWHDKVSLVKSQTKEIKGCCFVKVPWELINQIIL